MSLTQLWYLIGYNPRLVAKKNARLMARSFFFELNAKVAGSLQEVLDLWWGLIYWWLTYPSEKSWSESQLGVGNSQYMEIHQKKRSKPPASLQLNGYAVPHCDCVGGS